MSTTRQQKLNLRCSTFSVEEDKPFFIFVSGQRLGMEAHMRRPAIAMRSLTYVYTPASPAWRAVHPHLPLPPQAIVHSRRDPQLSCWVRGYYIWIINWLTLRCNTPIL